MRVLEVKLHASELQPWFIQPQTTQHTYRFIITLLGFGLVLLNSGNVDGAIKVYDNLISLRPNTPTAYFMRGVAYSRKGLQVRYW